MTKNILGLCFMWADQLWTFHSRQPISHRSIMCNYGNMSRVHRLSCLYRWLIVCGSWAKDQWNLIWLSDVAASCWSRSVPPTSCHFFNPWNLTKLETGWEFSLCYLQLTRLCGCRNVPFSKSGQMVEMEGEIKQYLVWKSKRRIRTKSKWMMNKTALTGEPTAVWQLFQKSLKQLHS